MIGQGIRFGVILAGGMLAISGSTVGAVQAQITQEVKPVECVYTTTETGVGENRVDSCQNQQVPTVEDVVVNTGRPVITGTFQASKAIALRVWINSQWYTYGTDTRLTIAGDEWTLDLSEMNTPLTSGNYEVVVEVETVDGLLLRHVSAASFYVPVVQNLPITTIDQSPVVAFIRNLFLYAPDNVITPPREQTISPPIQKEGADDPLVVDSPVERSPLESKGDSPLTILALSIGIPALVGVTYMIRRYRFRL